MALSFHYRSPAAPPQPPNRLAILPGAWNPPTVAHLAIARAALIWADEVLLVLPRSFPHKSFEGATFDDRIHMLCRIAAYEQRISVASSEGGLYLEIADEAASYFGPQSEIGLACGRDAAERIVAWDYGRAGVFRRDDRTLYAAGGGQGRGLPAGFGTRAQNSQFAPGPSFDDVSSSEIRRRISGGGAVAATGSGGDRNVRGGDLPGPAETVKQEKKNTYPTMHTIKVK